MSFIGNNPNVKWLTLTPQSADPTSPNEGDVFRSDGTSRAAGIWSYQSSVWVQVGGQTNSWTYRSVTSTDTAVTGDAVLVLSGASFTQNLYTAVGNQGKILTIIHNGTAWTQIYTIDPSGSQTINDKTTIDLNRPGEYIVIQSDNVNWNIIERSKLSTRFIADSSFVLPSGVNKADSMVVGGGGGGGGGGGNAAGGGGGGGGGGEIVFASFPVSSGETLTAVIGVGGTGGAGAAATTAGGDGTDGGDTTLTSSSNWKITAKKGSAGLHGNHSSGSGGAGGNGGGYALKGTGGAAGAPGAAGAYAGNSGAGGGGGNGGANNVSGSGSASIIYPDGGANNTGTNNNGAGGGGGSCLSVGGTGGGTSNPNAVAQSGTSAAANSGAGGGGGAGHGSGTGNSGAGGNGGSGYILVEF